MDEQERDFRIYDRLIDAVSSQVDRGRADLQFFLVLNASVAGGALASLQFLEKPQVAFLVFLLFAGGFGLAIAGLSVSKNNKKYYRALVVKRVMMEEKLGLLKPISGREGSQYANFSIAPTATSDKIRKILGDPDEYVTPRSRTGSNTDWSQWALRSFGVFHIIAALLLANTLAGCWAVLIPCS